MTTIETAQKLLDVCRGLDEVWQARRADGDQDYRTETMSIMSARDRISEIASELAQDESVSQEMNKQDDDEAEKNLEEDVNNS